VSSIIAKVHRKCGSPSIIGVEADREGLRQGFAHNADWKVSLIDETADVASSGDLAIYRGTYNEHSSSAGVTMTHKTNFIAAFKGQGDGPMEDHLVQRFEYGTIASEVIY
jgi:hypothetical protein